MNTQDTVDPCEEEARIKLESKLFIAGFILVQTGLHIGGSGTALEIGGLGLGVVKTPDGIPYIPGSGLKGKLRSIAAREDGSLEVKCDGSHIKRIFGSSGDDKSTSGPTRLQISDSHLDCEHFEDKFGVLEPYRWTEVKTENQIDRKSGAAQHPRDVERVPAGARFRFKLVYNVLNSEQKSEDIKNILTWMRILEDDYLGGQGSRGYGKVKFVEVKISERAWDQYKEAKLANETTEYTF